MKQTFYILVVLLSLAIFSCKKSKNTEIVKEPEPEPKIQISAGSDHTLVLKPDHTLWACGKNYDGQLGDGTTTTIKILVPITIP